MVTASRREAPHERKAVQASCERNDPAPPSCFAFVCAAAAREVS